MNTEKLEKAKAAFDADDPQASALLHKQKHFAKPWDPQAYSEAPVVQPVEYFKTGLSSAIDGSVTTSMVVSSLQGLVSWPHISPQFGFCLVALQALSLAARKFLFLHNDYQVVKREMTREIWEYENCPEGEIAEMVEIYMRKGLTKQQANELVNTLCYNTNNFIDTMMVEELGMLPPNPNDSPLKHGLHSFLGYLIGGVVPMMACLFFGKSSFNFTNSQIFKATTAVNSISLFALGATYSIYSHSKWWQAGCCAASYGAASSFVSYYLCGLTTYFHFT